MKCTNCGNTWHQNPVADPPPPMVPQGAHPAAAPQPYAQPQQPYPYPPQGQPGYPPPPPGYPPYPYPPQGQPGYPPPPGYPAPEAAQPQQPPAPEPAPPPPPPEPEEEDDLALPEMDDDDPMAAFATDDDDASGASDDGEEELSSADIEAMFGDDDDDPEPLGSMVESGGDDDDDDDGDIEGFDDLEEPEPIPQVFTAEETGDDEYVDDDEDEEENHEPEKKGGILKIVLIAVVVLLLGIVGAAIFLKDMVIEFVPAAEGVYSMIGLGDDALGAGLSINDVKSTRESISGKDVLVVRGVIVNVSDRERPVPLLELRLSDLDGKPVQSASTAPLKKLLAAGDQIGFKIQVEEPSALARRLEVTFIERPAGGAAQ